MNETIECLSELDEKIGTRTVEIFLTAVGEVAGLEVVGVVYLDENVIVEEDL